MEEVKCADCEKELNEKADDCSNCGMDEEKKGASEKALINVVEDQIPVAKTTTKINFKSWIGIALGAVMIFMGIFVLSKQTNDIAYNANKYYASPYSIVQYSFGADFYTEMYGSSCTIVDELNDINGNLADGLTDINEIASITTASICSTVNAIYFSVGMLIIAIGMSTIAISYVAGKKEQ